MGQRTRRLSLAEPSLRRAYTHRKSKSDSAITNATGLAKALTRLFLNNARHHLRDYASANQITAERFAPFLPNESDSQEAITLFHKWLVAPLLVSDDELKKILPFRTAHRAGDAVENTRQTYCYFRSWSMEKCQLHLIVQAIKAEGYPFQTFVNWEDALQTTASHDFVTVRYVGSTSREDPATRAKHRNHRGATSFVEKFEDKIRELLPMVPSKGTFNLIDNSCLFYGNARLAFLSDLYEGWMISFFDPRTLLNRQRGGINYSFLPSHEDICMFHRCRTSLTTRLATLRNDERPGLGGLVAALYRSLQPFIQEMTGDHRYIPQHLDAVSKQATPLQVKQKTLLVFCGQQTTKKSIEEGKGFFYGSTMAAQLSRTILDILAKGESDDQDCCFESVRSILCFSNLYQWIGDEIQQENTSHDIFNRWLSLLKPLLVVTLGKKVANVITEKSGCAPIKNLVRAVGRASIVDEGTEEMAILIPLLHPGFDRRSQQTSSQRRMYLIPYIAVWVYLDSALKLLQGQETGPWSRQWLCRSIYAIAEKKLQQAGFYEVLNIASETFLVEQAKAHPISHRATAASDSHIGSAILDPSWCNTITPHHVDSLFLDCIPHMRSFFEGVADGFHLAQGEPSSQERRRQIKSLYAQRHPSLTTHLNASNQQEWIEFLVCQPEGLPLLVCVEALEQPQCMPPAKIDLLELYGCEDLADFSCRRSTLNLICTEFSARQTNWIKRQDRRGPEKFSSTIEHQQYNGVRVYFSRSGTLTLCREFHGVQRKALIKHQAIATKTWLDMRSIKVDTRRIVVLDRYETELHAVNRVSCQSTELHALWDSMLGLDYADLSSGGVMMQSHDQLTAKKSEEGNDASRGMNLGQVKRPGRPPLKQNQNGAKLQNSPPEMADALWLLNEFINERFPNGGDFWTGDPAIFPESTADLQAFQRFLEGPTQSEHPWSTEWLELLRNPNGLITLSTSLKWLRDLQRGRRNAPSSSKSTSKSLRPQCSIYTLGPRKYGW